MREAEREREGNAGWMRIAKENGVAREDGEEL